MPVTPIPQVIAPSGIKSIQSGTITLSNQTSSTAAIAAVNVAKAQISWLGSDYNSSVAPLRLEITNSVTVTAKSSSAAWGTINFQVTEWY